MGHWTAPINPPDGVAVNLTGTGSDAGKKLSIKNTTSWNWSPSIDNWRQKTKITFLDLGWEKEFCWLKRGIVPVHFYRTRVRSLVMLVSDSLTDSLTHWLTPESARAVTGRWNSYSGRGEDFVSRQPDFFTETAVTPERKVEKWFPRWEINRHAEG